MRNRIHFLFTYTLATLIAANVMAQPGSQLRNAGTAASVTGAPCGTAAWGTLTNATGAINNGTFSRSQPAVNNNSACLELTNGGFTIPVTAVITGIRVDIRRTTSRTNTNDANVQLLKGGVKTGTNKANFNGWPQALTTVTYGANGDLWGTTWTPAQINAANFGFSFAALRSGGTTAPNIDVDGVEITVYYIDASVYGTVFRDYNANGVMNTTGGMNERGVGGVTVTATLANGSVVTTTTDNAGFYYFTTAQIPAATQVRVEFSNTVAADAPSFSGTGNGTNVQFITTAATPIVANYAINAADDYWDNIGQPNPKLLGIVYAHGDINHTNSANTTFGIIQIDNNTTGHTPTTVNVATQAQVGSVWGMGLQKTHNRFFFSNFLKRHVGFGPQGVGGIYMANLSGANYALSGSFTMQNVVPANSAVALDMGTVNRVSTPNTSNFYLATASDAEGKDLDAFAKACKVGFGDIEVDDRNQQLVMVNLNQRRLVTLDISGTTASLNGASAATLGPLTRAYNILSLPGVPSCTSGELRPFALKIYKGRGYLGAVCDASATPRDSTNLAGYILSFDPANIGAGFTTELTLNFNYRTSSSNGNTNRWHSWVDAWSDVRSGGLYRYPEPLISDIEFDENGGMNISITDRFGHQMGVSQTVPVAGDATVIGEARISGDILHACRVGSAWVMEGAAGSCPVANTVDNPDGYGDGQTVGVYEYYDDQSGDNSVGEYTEGAMAKLMGSNRLVQTIVDPNPAPNTTGEPYWYSAGMHWYDINSGSWSNWTSLYDGSDAGAPAGTFMKGNGLGDIEFITTPQPIQVGNRIWMDTNGNGIQDASETTVGVPAGTIVTLRSPGLDGIYGNADDQTWTTTTDASGNYYFSALSTADNRKPATWTGVGNVLLPGYNYRIELTIPAGSQLTKSDAAVNTLDNIDNDAISGGGTLAIIPFNTGNTNHNFDIGLKQLATIGDRVWRDDNKDGLQGASEPGVANITVTLYQNGTDGVAGTADDVVIGTTVTDAYGNYLFDNLTPTNQTSATTINQTSYNVGFTLPANYTFTTSVTPGDNGNNTNSDPNVTTGRTVGYNLTAGERDLTVDAGIIFNTPTVTASVGDRVWFDTNANGTQDAGEPGVSGVTVTLYNNAGVAVATTITDANGNYLFTNVTPANGYTVGFTPPAGTAFTTSTGAVSQVANSDANTTTGRTSGFNVAAGEQVTYVDAGLVLQSSALAALGDRVWYDNNRDGDQDAGEPGIAGITVNLYLDADGNGVLLGTELTTPVRTTTTDAFGNYIFNGLTPGSYGVLFVAPSGLTITTKDATGGAAPLDATDSDADQVTGRTVLYGLPAGAKNLSVDCGMYSTAPAANVGALGNFVWNDLNGNGVQDGGEPGVAGITVILYNNAGTAVDTVTTDATGGYLFTNLAPGNYTVGFSNLPAGFSFTGQDRGGNDASDSDVNPGTGRTASATVTAGATNTTVDAGVRQGVPSGLGSLGNRVWYDLNNNGLQDAGELGVAGVTVTLLDAGADGIVGNGDDGTSRTTLTNALGEYLFGGLPAGNYVVQFGTAALPLPTGFTAATQNAGTNDNIDSDGGAIATGGAPAGSSRTAVYNLAQGEDNLSVDLGIVPPVNTNTVSGQAWFDNAAGGGTAADGIRNGTEVNGGVAGITVTLYNGAGVAVGTTTTDANGNFSFVGVPNGTGYTVGFSNYPPGMNPSPRTADGANNSDADRVNGRTGSFNLTGGTNIVNMDAGIFSNRAALGNFVWSDLDGDGVQDAGEPGVSGVTVGLFYDADNNGSINGAEAVNTVATAITDANGAYFFPNLLPGLYHLVSFSTIPTNMVFTRQNTPGDNGDNTNSDAAPGAGFTSSIVLVAGEVDNTIDAGVAVPQPATIGNRVWADLDKNGLQDAGEPGISGILVTLYNSSNVAIGSAITDGNGNWQITNVPAGTGYYLIFTPNLPSFNTTATPGSNPAWTQQNIGANGTAVLSSGTESDVDSDVTPTGATAGRTSAFNIVAGNNFPNMDAGIINWPFSSLLPIKLESFTAAPQGSNVLLKWTVSEEINVDRYEIEFSTNGRDYAVIGNTAGANLRNYQLLHTSPVIGINYYRLKTMDKDGQFTYSEVRKVNFGKGNTLSVYPNPVKDNLSITVTGDMVNKPATISILAMDGKLMLQQRINAMNQTESIHTNALGSGKYIIRIVTDAEVINRSIEVIR